MATISMKSWVETDDIEKVISSSLFKKGGSRTNKVLFFATDTGLGNGDITLPVELGEAKSKSSMKDMLSVSCFNSPQYRTNLSVDSTGSLTYTINETQEVDDGEGVYFDFNGRINPLKHVLEYLYANIETYGADKMIENGNFEGNTLNHDIVDYYTNTDPDEPVATDKYVFIATYKSSVINSDLGGVCTNVARIMISDTPNLSPKDAMDNKSGDVKNFLVYFNPDYMVTQFDRLEVYYYVDTDNASGAEQIISSAEWNSQINKKLMEIFQKGNFKQVTPFRTLKALPIPPGDIYVHFYVFSLIPESLKTFSEFDTGIKDAVKGFVREIHDNYSPGSDNRWVDYFGAVAGKSESEVFPDLFNVPTAVIFNIGVVGTARASTPLTTYTKVVEDIDRFTTEVVPSDVRIDPSTTSVENSAIFALSAVSIGVGNNFQDDGIAGFPLMVCSRQAGSSIPVADNPLGINGMNFNTFPENTYDSPEVMLNLTSLSAFDLLQRCVSVALLYLQGPNMVKGNFNSITEIIESGRTYGPNETLRASFGTMNDKKIVTLSITGINREFRIYYDSYENSNPSGIQ